MTARAVPSTARLAGLLVAVAIVARAATFGNPVIHVDEDFYFTVARAMWGGAVPYIDIWDRKPVGLFLLYLPPTALPFWWGIWAYQAMALAAVVATALIVVRFAQAAGWRAGAVLAGAAYILWLNVAGGQGGQSPVFYNLPMAGAAYLVATNDARWWRRDAAAMLLVGVALTIKTSAVFEGAFFGLWVVARDLRAAGMRVAGWVALAAIALAPSAAIVGWYWAHEAIGPWLYANIWSIMARSADPPREKWGNFAQLMLFLSPLVAMAFGARGAADGDARLRRFAFAWFGVALAGILVFGGWYEHYALPAMVPGTLCPAGFFGRRPRAGVAIIAIVGLVGVGATIANRVGRGGPAQFAALVRAIDAAPAGCLWVYSGDTKLYPASERCRLSRYVFPSHLYRMREAGAIGVDQAAEVRRILGLRPAVVVMRPPSIGERLEIRAIVMDAVARDYRVAARTPLGDETITVYGRAR